MRAGDKSFATEIAIRRSAGPDPADGHAWGTASDRHGYDPVASDRREGVGSKRFADDNDQRTYHRFAQYAATSPDKG